MFLISLTVADIQEFYELTLLDESKSVQQKTAETNRIAAKWEASDGPITPTFAQNDVSRVTRISIFHVSCAHTHTFSLFFFCLYFSPDGHALCQPPSCLINIENTFRTLILLI